MKQARLISALWMGVCSYAGTRELALAQSTAPNLSTANFVISSAPRAIARTIGSVRATNTVSFCSISHGNAFNFFAVTAWENSCVLNLTAAGANGIAGDINTFSLTIRADNAAGSGSNVVTVTTYGDGSLDAPPSNVQHPHLLDTRIITDLSAIGGNGYTNGINLTLTAVGCGGSGFAGAIDVLEGKLTNPTIVSGGSGYNCRPTIAVPAKAGRGRGGAIIPTVLQVRPAWKVAGIDYAVGYPSGTVFKDPTTQLPAGASYSSAGPVITVAGNNVILDGYDFGNATIVMGAAATGTMTVMNSKIAGRVYAGFDTSANLIITKNVIGGRGIESDPNFGLLDCYTTGRVTVTYNWIKGGPNAIHGQPSLTARFNLLEQFGWNPPDHANAIYSKPEVAQSALSATQLQFNTLWSGATQPNTANGTRVPIGLGAAIAFFTDGGSIHNAEVGFNVVLSSVPGGASYLIGFYTYRGANGYIIDNSNVHDNYVASLNGFNNANSGAFGAFYGPDANTNATYTNNIDMNTGYQIAFP